MALILDGKKLRDKLAVTLAKKIAKTLDKPKLVIIQIGNIKESNTYIEKKKIFGNKIGVLIVHKRYPASTTENEIISDISKHNSSQTVHGIILQLPIPKRLDKSRIIEAINPKKDVDGLTARNTKYLFDKTENFIPATTRGIITMLQNYKINPEGKKVVIVGQSALVGRPTALAFLNRGATVTICHTRTKNLAEETRRADILIVATGRPLLITAKHVSKGQTVIDVGITVMSDKKIKIAGDVDYKKVKNIVAAITPVPGGIGPMTVFSLFENLVKSYFLLTKKETK